MIRAPRDLDEEPLRPGEFPVEGDWGVSVLGDEAIDLPPDYKNGQWGFSGRATAMCRPKDARSRSRISRLANALAQRLFGHEW